ncbi:MAG: hypothetical protein ACNI3C_08855 [Candidatus Marinarcus sp.]|uniref:hypothetical protein n=1 Tax=Candidatus Marinarcus sp. TaxID=3100987 RepID=UPI003AFFB6FF
MDTCSKRKCETKLYNEFKHCIFHCDKKDFTEQNIINFWQELRSKYIAYDNYGRFLEDMEITDVNFPKFEVFNRHSRNNNFYKSISYSRDIYNKNLIFKNCVFYGDFNLIHFSLNCNVVFENCTFHGDIIASIIDNCEFISCEFKNAISLNKCRYKKLKISSNTKFIKEVNFNVQEELDIQDTVFRSNFSLNGNHKLEANIQNNQFDKEFITSGIEILKVNDTILKSNVFFKNYHNEIYLENLNFIKTVSFEDSNFLEVKNAKFNQNSIFKENGLQIVKFITSEVTNLELNTLKELSIQESTINGEINLVTIDTLLSIENSKLLNRVKTRDIKNVTIHKSYFFQDFMQEQECNDFIVNNSIFLNLEIFTSNKVLLNSCTITKKLTLEGENYEIVEVHNCAIFEELNLSSSKDISIKNLKKNPLLKIKGDEYTNVDIQQSRISELHSPMMKKLEVKRDSIIKRLNIDNISDIILENTKIKEDCIFSTSLERIDIKNDSVFYKNIECNDIKIIVIEHSQLKGDFIINGQVDTLSIAMSQVIGKFKSSKINALSFTNSDFQDELNLEKLQCNHFAVIDSKFAKLIDLKNSFLEKIEFHSVENIGETRTIFNGEIDFSFSEIQEIIIENAIFNKTIIFNHLKNIFEFNKLKNINFNERVLINNTALKDLFDDSENLYLKELSISKSKLSTNDNLINKIGKKEIYLYNLKIDNFSMKEVVFQNNINFENIESKNFEISNSNIEKVFRVRQCVIENFISIDNIFEDLQIIDNRYNKHKSTERDINLSNTTVKSGVFDKLKFDNFIMNDAHVSEAKIGYVKFKNASRETNRFFKNYYDSISDYITANTYYQREMIEQMKECKSWKSSEWWILIFNKVISNFGQNWVFPVLWMLFITLLLYRVANFDLLSMNGFRENHVTWMINDILKFSNPFSKTAVGYYGMFYWAWIVHKLLMTAFIYHFIIAIKRKTRR